VAFFVIFIRFHSRPMYASCELCMEEYLQTVFNVYRVAQI